MCCSDPGVSACQPEGLAPSAIGALAVSGPEAPPLVDKKSYGKCGRLLTEMGNTKLYRAAEAQQRTLENPPAAKAKNQPKSKGKAKPKAKPKSKATGAGGRSVSP